MQVSPSKVSSKSILLIFAPWCPSCVNTLPEFNKLFKNKRLKDHGIKVFSINVDQYRDIPLQVSGFPVKTVPHIVIKDSHGNFKKFEGERNEKAFADAAIKFTSQHLEGGHWDTPKSKSERMQELKKFGSHCFLLPNELKFPVCDSSGNLSKEGLEAAYKRAREWHYEEVAAPAKRILEVLWGTSR